jgi:DNA recombination protein RmuC
MMSPADAITLLVLAVLLGLNVYALIRRARDTTERRSITDDLARLNERLQQALAAARQESAESAAAQRRELLAQMQELGRTLHALLASLGEGQQRRIAELTAAQQGQFDAVRKTLDSRLESLRSSVGEQLDKVRQENAAKLEDMRRTVDEKLHDTLEKRLGESFKQVSDRLEQVHKGLGEMQALAIGVGDLKKVLTNVKTRGSWGEVQLGVLLEQLLTADQYAAQVRVRPRATETVDFAIRLPGRDAGDTPVWLPIDAKFPKEDYERLSEAAERGDAAGVEAAVRQLDARIRQEARDIRDKYISPPDTTDFAILYLPTEGLYAEVLRRPGLADLLQRECRVVVAGPTTLAALLNSLQMGFRSLAIQKRSSEVWKLLAAVKKKFEGFGDTFSRVQKKIQEADKALEDARSDTEIIGKRLRLVESADEAAVRDALALPPGTEAE